MSDGATESYFEIERKPIEKQWLKKQKDNRFWIDIAHKFAERSSCCRVKVGGVLVKNGRSICSAWNGVASEQEHCEDYFKKSYSNQKKDLKFANLFTTFEQYLSSPEFKEEHRVFSINNELHVEMNIINYSSRQDRESSILYLTISPCMNCAKLIVASGIKKVYYRTEYDREIAGIDYLNKHNILCEKVEQ